MKKVLWALGGTVIAMVVLIVVGLFFLDNWLDRYTHHDEAVKVPLVVGQSADIAALQLQQAGLVPMIIDSVYADVRPGSVIEQMPEGGLPVKLGRIVYLTINSYGKQMIKMVDVKDWSRRQALSTLEEIGFVVDSVKYEPYEYDDIVLRVSRNGQALESGASCPIKTHVVVHVGSAQLKETNMNGEDESEWFE